MFSSTEADTVITNLFTGRPARAIRNRYIEKYLELDAKPLAWPLQGLAADDIYAESRKQNKTDYYPLLAGQGLRLLKRGNFKGILTFLPYYRLSPQVPQCLGCRRRAHSRD
jgi:nitronate monooxygenase